MIITYVYPNEPENWENIEWRCLVPAAAINRTGIHKANVLSDSEFSNNSNDCIAACLESDIIVIYKKVYGKVITAIHHWQAREKIIIVDFDEAYQLLDPDSDEYHFWFDGIHGNKENVIRYISPAPLTQFKWGLKLVDGITVPSNRLAKDWINFNEIVIVPNYINLDSYIPDQKKINTNKLIMGWHGKNQQFQNFKTTGLFDALSNVFVQSQMVALWIYLDDEFNTDLEFENDEQIKIVENCRKETWLAGLTNIDIGLLPLLGDFDQRQSMRTALEYMVMKIPWIASQSSAYHEMEGYGEFVDNQSDSWKDKLFDMIRHYDAHRINASQEPYLLGIGKSVDENIHRTIDLYERIIASKKS
jgi:hypothetical protein